MVEAMLNLEPEHPLSYRQEVVAPLFRALRAGDSCALVGPASMGKSRLLQFIVRADVRRHGLGDRADTMLLIVADGNRLAEISEWGLYELLLTALVEAVGVQTDAAPARAELAALQREAIVSRDPLLARRHTELAAHILCQERGLSLCFILDEFDVSYRSLPALALANLRALRDRNKYRLNYVLLLREHPARLRFPAEDEGFYELFSRAVLGLRPYSAEDAGRVVAQLEARKAHALTLEARMEIVRLSGGHPGIIVALFDAVAAGGPPARDAWQAWAAAQPTLREECRKLWAGLADDEQLALGQLVRELDVPADIYDVLLLKGLIGAAEGRVSLFSPLFTDFVLTHGVLPARQLLVDEAARMVWLGERSIDHLTAREFDLLVFLYQHAGYVCTRDQLLAYLYPGEVYGANDNRVDTLVKRVREKIEPVRERPRYLITVRGKGYKLVVTEDSNGVTSE